jgi:hypothetical protein
MTTTPQPLWHALCTEPGRARSCHGCARNPEFQPEAVKARGQRMERPMIASDNRCSSWLPKREP